jgi:hypothetical protein
MTTHLMHPVNARRRSPSHGFGGLHGGLLAPAVTRDDGSGGLLVS